MARLALRAGEHQVLVARLFQHDLVVLDDARPARRFFVDLLAELGAVADADRQPQRGEAFSCGGVLHRIGEGLAQALDNGGRRAGGARKPDHTAGAKSAIPSSIIVGTSGRLGSRSSAVTPSTRM